MKQVCGVDIPKWIKVEETRDEYRLSVRMKVDGEPLTYMYPIEKHSCIPARVNSVLFLLENKVKRIGEENLVIEKLNLWERLTRLVSKVVPEVP